MRMISVLVMFLSIGICLGSPTRSSIGAVHSKFSQDDETFDIPYVTDGLVAMWDGEWNAGGGVHDASTTTWKELISGQTTDISGKGTFSDSYFDIPSATSIPLVSDSFSSMTAVTFEYVFADSGPTQNKVYFEANQGNNNFSLQSNFSSIRLFAIYRGPVLPLVTMTELPSGQAIAGYSVCLSADSSGCKTFVNGSEKGTYGTVFASFSSVGIGLRVGLPQKVYAIRIYSRALTAEEIAHNYAIDKERFNLP